MGSAAFFEPETRASPSRRAPPRMTIFCTGPGRLGGGRRVRGGRCLAGVLVTEPAVHPLLPAAFLAARLVTMRHTHVVAPAPGHKVLAAQALGSERLVAPV